MARGALRAGLSLGHTKGCECACGDRARDASEAPGAEKAPKYQGSPLCDPSPGNSAGAREGVDPPRVRPGLQAQRARSVERKPGTRRAPGGAGKAKPNRFIWDPFLGGSQIRSVSSRPRTEVGVPGAAEVSSGCVLGPWERVGIRSLRVSWEVTHGDKKTPGNESGDIRTPPGLGDCGSARSPFPTSPRSLSPRAATISTVTYLAGTECSQGNRTPGGPRPGVRSLPRGAPSGTRSRGRGQGGLAPACQLGKPRSRTYLSLTAAGRTPAQPALGSAGRSRGPEPSSALRRGGGTQPPTGAVGGGKERSCVVRDGASGCVCALGLRHLLSGAPGGPNPVRNSLSKDDRAEQSRAIRSSDATAQRGL